MAGFKSNIPLPKSATVMWCYHHIWGEQHSHLFYNCNICCLFLIFALLFLVLSHFTLSLTQSLSLYSLFSLSQTLAQLSFFLPWNFPWRLPQSSTAGRKEGARSVFLCDGVSVCVLDSSKCHGISHGNASQHLMSATLFLQLSAQRTAHFHMRAETQTHKGSAHNCRNS